MADASAADDVVRAYTQRWSFEEFHRRWKSAATKVQEVQVRSVENVERIVRMSAFVPCRLLCLTHLARTKPDADAPSEFSRAGIQR